MNTVLPLVKLLYITTFNASWSALLFSTVFLTWAAITLLLPFYLKNRKQYKNHEIMHKNNTSILVFYIIMTLFVIQFLLTRKLWYYHMLPTLSFGIIIFSLYLAQDFTAMKSIRAKKKLIGAPLLIRAVASYCCLILLPINLAYSVNRSSSSIYHNPKSGIRQIIQFINQHTPNSPLYVFSTTVIPGSTLIDYTNIQYGSRFSGFWMLPGILQLSKQTKKLDPRKQKALIAAKKFQFKLVIEDFKNYQPKLVLVQINPPYFSKAGFNFIRYFSKNREFSTIWKKYKKIGQLPGFNVYQLK